MPTDYRDSYADCDSCGTRADMPNIPGEHRTVARRRLVDQGWSCQLNHAERPVRILPYTYIWTCPDCRPGKRT